MIVMKKKYNWSLMQLFLLALFLPLSAAMAQGPVALMPKAGGYARSGLYGKYCPAPASVRSVQPIRKAAGGKALKPQRILSTKDGAEIWGVVLYANTHDDSEWQDYGVFRFNAKSPVTFKSLLADHNIGSFAGGAFYDDHFHYTYYYTPYQGYAYITLYDYDTNGWNMAGYQSVYSNSKISSTDQAYDPVTGKVYGYFYDMSDSTSTVDFGTIDYATGAVTTIKADEGLLFVALAFDSTGQLWGINNFGNLWKIDKNTGEVTDLVSVLTPVEPSTFSQSMTFDPNSGLLYWSCFRRDYTSGLYVIDTRAADPKPELVADFPNDEEVACLHIPVVSTAAGAPAGVRDLTLTFAGGATEGTAAFTMPAETFGGNPLDGTLSYAVVANSDTVARGTAVAGTRVEAAVSVPTGMTRFTVCTHNAAGKSPDAEAQSLYVGYDEPVVPEIVAFDLDDSRKVTLKWRAARAGVNGGYLSPDLSYRVVRLPGEVVVADGFRDTTFAETLPEGAMQVYRYRVTAVNGTMESLPATTEGKACGSAFDLPYTDHFDDDDNFALYTVLDLGGSGQWIMSNGNARIFHFSGQSDDWLITPPLNLKAGSVYHVSCLAEPGYSSAPDALEILLGQRTDTVGYRTVVPVTAIGTSGGQTVEGTFKVSESGVYRIAFRSVGGDSSYGIILDDIAVEEQSASSVPAAPAEMKVTPAAKGSLRATVTFKTPATDTDGKALEKLTAVEVWRNDTVLVRHFDNPAVGQTMNVVDTKPANGMNHYAVKAANESGFGESALDSAYVGQDVPAVPTNIVLKDNLDGTATLTWDLPGTTGANGHYVATDKLTFNVYDAQGEVVGANLDAGSRSCTFDAARQTGGFDLLYYGVSATSVAGEGAIALSNTLVIGSPKQLPVYESFANGYFQYGGWWYEGNQPYNAPSLPDDKVADHDNGALYWKAYNDGETGWLSTPKLSFANCDQPGIVFRYYAQPGHDQQIAFLGVHPDASVDTLINIRQSELGGVEGWRKAVYYLNDRQKSAAYMVLRLMMKAGKRGEEFWIDDIQVRNFLHRDLSAAIAMPASAVRGRQTHANVTVENLGCEAVSPFRIELREGDSVLASQDVRQPLAALSDSTYEVAYTPALTVADQQLVKAVVVADGDEYARNNESEILELAVANPACPTARNLKAETDGTTVKLTWERPDTEAFVTTEDFETAQPWLLNDVNGFTTFDGDGIITNSWTSMWYRHIGEPFAWILFNDQQAKMDDSQRPCFEAHSGHQMMTTVANVHEYGVMGNESDDWLISPELSGEAQTVSFWVRCIGGYQEDFDVWYSETAPDTLSLRKNKIDFVKFTPLEWTQYSYDLPVGARYFAIRWPSNLTGIGLDDFTYKAPAPELMGYNIYCDGKAVGTATADALAFTRTDDGDSKHVYHITAVYKDGESALSNAAGLTPTGIGAVTADGVAKDVYSVGGVLVRRQARSVSGLRKGLYIVNGKKVVNR